MPHPVTATLARAAASLGARIGGFEPARRTVLGAVAGSTALLLGTAGVGIAQSRTDVMVEVDGVVRPVSSWTSEVGDILAAAGITPADHDLVQPARGQSVPDGGTVVVRTARPHTVAVDGVARTIWSTSSSADAILADSAALGATVSLAADRSSTRQEVTPLVARARSVDVEADGQTAQVVAREGQDARAVLDSAGIGVGPLDRVSVSADAAGQMTVAVERAGRGTVTETVPIDFEQTETTSDTMFIGESQVTSLGSAGSLERTVWRETEDGRTVHEAVLDEKIVAEPVAQVLTRGTKEATPESLAAAGLDPTATLEEAVEADGTTSVRYRKKLSSAAASTGSAPSGTYSGEDPRGIAQQMVAARGWSDAEFQCLLNLWQRESGWNPYARNASSGAYGIPQSLPGSKMASAGADWMTNPATQITWGLGYIAGRYGTPCGAWAHSNSVGWY
ncbi:ubiquitin-like domain-containing protein [Actinomyces sp. B33]|uniref:aggregation-promoting factor C-terminal-like domain-containing protein n=1 Tax=Actinomyces sp. B33 TaxID=2942131 RepID=UPI0023405253|nr:ubiquitin-like domain-containing protein [Actinomyces sp. B33]MDC4233756.1 ubiquitin-like domain-containing protein [Actinomyces sp. B33]